MEEKFRYEHHNRQDKAKKPDYRDEFTAESQYKASQFHLKNFKDDLVYKAELLRRYEHGAFIFNNRILRLNWTAQQYVEANNLGSLTDESFRPHRKAALEDYRAIREAIRNGRPDWCVFKEKLSLQLIFTIRLKCEAVFPVRMDCDGFEVRSLYKRI